MTNRNTSAPGVHSNQSEENSLNNNLSYWQYSLINEFASDGATKCSIQSWVQEEYQSVLEPHCNASWDGTYCWPRALANTSVTRPCSELFETDINSSLFTSGAEVTKHCLEDGTWHGGNWTDYGECDLPQSSIQSLDIRIAVGYVLFIGSCISLLSLSLALFIFQYFKSIRCERITIHVHFMVALVLKCVVFLIISEGAVFGLTSGFFGWDWYCKLIASWQMYASVASVNWMFVQGHYLNSKLTTNVFAKKKPVRFYIIFGWGFSFATILIWFIAMEIEYNDVRCWDGHAESRLIWLLLAPILIVLLANLLFLFNIIRVLLTKIQLTSNDTEGRQFFRALKATVVLFPLLGLNILLLFYNPGGSMFLYYMLINATIHSSQGLFVAIFYCFICHDVRDAIRREYRKLVSPRSINSFRSRSITQHTMTTRMATQHLQHHHHRATSRKSIDVEAKYIVSSDQVVLKPEEENDNHYGD